MVDNNEKVVIAKSENVYISHEEWGRLTWYMSGRESEAAQLTLGKCEIFPECSNPRHFHPNCQEVLHVLKGTIEHRIGDKAVAMTEGDTILIPEGEVHNAKNLSDETAVMVISFSSAERQTVKTK